MSNSTGWDDNRRTFEKFYRSMPGDCDPQSTGMTVSNGTAEAQDYVTKVLEAYRATPGTCGKINRADRFLAHKFFETRIPLHAIENALVLAAGRRTFRPPDAPPLNMVRSLAYFVPVIEEVLETGDSVREDYYEQIRSKLKRLGKI
jgi:hypothetical protein